MWDKLRRLGLGAWLVVAGCRSDPQGKASQPGDRSARRDARTAVASAPGPAAPAAGDRLDGASTPPLPDVPTRYRPAQRVVALGDVHGDLDATRRALRLAGAIDGDDHWIGGDLVVVQTGDQLDRGDEERAILELFEGLREQAAKAGGAFHALNGNHEIMNAAGDLRYVTPGGFEDFADVPGLDLSDGRLSRIPASARPRAAAFMPGAPYARMLARRNVVIIVGDTVFVHGGVLPEHVAELETLNDEVRRWLHGTHARPAEVVQAIMAPDSPVWTRAYSDDVGPEDCAMLEDTLRALSVSRMVVGHTVQQEGITSACDAKVWRIDVGMAAHYGGRPQALEIENGRVRVLTEAE